MKRFASSSQPHTCFFHSGWTFLQYVATMFLMFSLRRCSDACKSGGIQGYFARDVLAPTCVFDTHVYLGAQRRRCWPAFI